MPVESVERLGERDEVARDESGSLMNQLIEGVLAVCARLPPVNRAGVGLDLGAIEGDMLAIALHRQLLEIGGESLEVLVVAQDATVCAPKKSLYQMPNRPMMTGRLRSNGAVRKCSSI